ncbi:Protein N-terminal amidase, partial [Madurella mycetomatis]
MKIACLQFSPQVGDIDNNLNRADAVLNKANAEDLEGLDLLVLPELAFTGYNFKSLQHISPFLEHAGSGITSLWARTTALKHDCTVVVGYPEKVDVSAKWPTSPEYYNSALVVDNDGDTIANYRKSFLYYTDETWALEGGDGFFEDTIPGLGNVALGICTDLNPYKLEAPWDAFEFGFHVLDSHANVVIMTMAWQTHQDPSSFSRRPNEPDLETLVYWVQRLEPLIRAERDDEVIVVFCNRTGAEEEATYTGTSAVIGIKGGEVFVYGVLGRGVKDILVVDTNSPPKSKLTDADGVEAENEFVEETVSDVEGDPTPDDARAAQVGYNETLPAEPQSPRYPGPEAGAVLSSPRSATTPRLPWLAPSDPAVTTPTDSRSPTRLQIPTSPPLGQYMPMDSAITDDVIIDSPGESRSPISSRRPPRPNPAVPSSPWRFPPKTSPYPWHHDAPHSSVFGGGAAMTPITPFDEDVWTATPIDPKTPLWLSRHEPTLSALTESVREEEEDPNRPSEEQKQDTFPSHPLHATTSEADSSRTEEKMDHIGDSEERVPLTNDWADLAGVLEELKVRPGSALDRNSCRAGRPSSPKSRNLSRSTSRSRLAQLSESAAHDEWQSANYGAYSHLLARPASRAGQRIAMRRSSSLDDISDKSRTQSRGSGDGRRLLDRRLPSQLRHAVFIPDEPEEGEEEDGPNYDYESDRQFSDGDDGDDGGGGYNTRYLRRDRQLHARETPVERSTSGSENGEGMRRRDNQGALGFDFSWPGNNEMQNQALPTRAEQVGSQVALDLSLPSAIEEAVPGLSSATSSVLTLDDDPVASPKLSGYIGTGEPAVVLRDRAVSPSSSNLALKTRIGG